MNTFEQWLMEHHPEYLEGFNDWPWWKKALATGVIGGVGSWGASKALDLTAGKLLPGNKPQTQQVQQVQQQTAPPAATSGGSTATVTPRPTAPTQQPTSAPSPSKKRPSGGQKLRNAGIVP